jgi:hypothetical protein
MKDLIKENLKLVLITFTISLFGYGKSYAGERIVLHDSKNVSLKVNETTVRCSEKGYGLSELKVNIHDLDGWTILDHSNAAFGEFNGEPCMTAGACKSPISRNGFDLQDILSKAPDSTKAIVERTIVEKKEVTVDGENNVCRRTITENLKTKILNIDFHHSRSFSQDFDVEACK